MHSITLDLYAVEIEFEAVLGAKLRWFRKKGDGDEYHRRPEYDPLLRFLCCRHELRKNDPT